MGPKKATTLSILKSSNIYLGSFVDPDQNIIRIQWINKLAFSTTKRELHFNSVKAVPREVLTLLTEEHPYNNCYEGGNII